MKLSAEWRATLKLIEAAGPEGIAKDDLTKRDRDVLGQMFFTDHKYVTETRDRVAINQRGVNAIAD